MAFHYAAKGLIIGFSLRQWVIGARWFESSSPLVQRQLDTIWQNDILRSTYIGSYKMYKLIESSCWSCLTACHKTSAWKHRHEYRQCLVARWTASDSLDPLRTNRAISQRLWPRAEEAIRVKRWFISCDSSDLIRSIQFAVRTNTLSTVLLWFMQLNFLFHSLNTKNATTNILLYHPVRKFMAKFWTKTFGKESLAQPLRRSLLVYQSDCRQFYLN